MAIAINGTGTHLYIAYKDANNNDVVGDIGCITGDLELGNDSKETTETKCLSGESVVADGSVSYGEVALTILANNKDDVHLFLNEAREQTPTPELDFAVGWSNDQTPPTIDPRGGFALSLKRDWNRFSAKITGFNFKFVNGGNVEIAITLQRTTPVSWLAAA